MNHRPFIEWDWIGDHLDDVRSATYEHLRLTLIAVVVGVLIAAALTLIGIRWRRTLSPITAVAGVIYTIPSLALFVALIPVFGFGSIYVAEIALVGYTLLILIRNMVAGIDGVDAAVRDAAIGMGYTPGRRLAAVELPLALPTIIAGIRIAAVTTVGLVTVTGLIGFGGYGHFINEGLKRQFSTEIILGAGLSVIMATALDLVLVGIERLFTPWKHGSRR